MTKDQHTRANELVTNIQKDLEELSLIVYRAPYTDNVLRTMRFIQERLIDPLRATWDKTYNPQDNPYHPEDNPYPNVGYSVSMPKQLRGKPIDNPLTS